MKARLPSPIYRASSATPHLAASFAPRIIIIAVFAITSLVIFQSFTPWKQLAISTRGEDMILNNYILAWGSHALFHCPARYYDPPIFYPQHFMLPSTDGLEAQALLLSPFWYLFHNPVLMGNLCALLSHFFALAGSYYAARKVIRLQRAYACLVALLFSVSSSRFYHTLGHMNLVWTGLLPLLFATFWVGLQTRAIRPFLVTGLILGAAIYFSVYLFVLGALLLPITAILWIISRRQLPRMRVIGLSAAACVLAFVLAAPKISIYRTASQRSVQVRTTYEEAARNSATWQGWLKPSRWPDKYLSYWYVILPRDTAERERAEDNEFLGYLLLGILGLELGRLTLRILQRKPYTRSDRLSAASLVAGVILFLCSLGPNFRLLGFSPYVALHETYFKHTGFYRVPARLAFIIQWILLLPVAVLFQRRFFRHINPVGRVLIPAIAAPIILFEHLPKDRPDYLNLHPKPIYAALDRLDPGGTQPYISLTLSLDLTDALLNTHNFRPTVNGWYDTPFGTGFKSRYWEFRNFPTPSLLTWMHQNRIPWVVTSLRGIRSQIESSGEFELMHEQESAALFRLKEEIK